MAKRKASQDVDYTMPDGLSREEQAAYEVAALKQGGSSWPGKDPQPGATFVGEFVSVQEVPNTLNRKGDPQRKYTFQRDGSNVNLWGSAVLNSELDSLNLEVGDKVLILFKGYASTHKKGQNPAKLFSAVRVETPKRRR